MQHLRSHDDVDAPVAKWQFQGVASHNRVISTAIPLDKDLREVEPDRSERHSAFRSQESGGFGYVGSASPHVEQGRAFRELANGRFELAQRGARSTEELVRMFDIGHRALHHFRWNGWIVEDLDSPTTPRSQAKIHTETSTKKFTDARREAIFSVKVYRSSWA